jgi:hypothetical protein
MSINTHAISSIATTTQEDIVPVSNYIWYKMYETASPLTDNSGNAANITISGTLTNAFDNEGYITPNGTDVAALGTLDAHVKSIMRMDTMTNNQLIISFDYFYDGDVTGNEQFFTYGRGGSSGYGLYLNSADQIAWQIAGDTGLNENTTFSGFSLSAAHGNKRNTITCDIQGAGNGTASIDIYINGVLVVSAPANITLAGTGTGGTTDINDDGLTLMAYRIAAATVGRLMSGAAGNARMGNFFAMQLASIDVSLAGNVNLEFYNKQGDLPLCLDGK